MRAIPRIPTRRHPIARLIDSRTFAVAVYLAALLGVVLANLEKFA